LFLIIRKVISPIIPCAFIGTVFVYALIATGSPYMALFHVLAGGVLLGAFFMATDYVTSPKLPLGQLIFGIGCGIITMSIRLFGSYPEGVSFSILLMNICTPLLNNLSYKFYLKEGGAKNGK
jgi:electron transport complex protein RnfD